MMPAADLLGKKFGRLVVVARSPSKNGRAQWECGCECGSARVVSTHNLRRGAVKSCGCLKITVRHGQARRRSKTTEYLIWVAMHQRCGNPSNKRYKNYGGRGITVCQAWSKFEVFLADVGSRPSRLHSLDRIDNDKGYGPDNCRWATQQEQTRNTRRNVIVTIGDENMTLIEAVERFGGNYGTALARVKRGLPHEEALKIKEELV